MPIFIYNPSKFENENIASLKNLKTKVFYEF